MVKKTVNFNREGIEKLPNDKPVAYKIKDEKDKNVYTGVAQRGRVNDRLCEHLKDAKDAVPGTKVQIEQMTSIDEAKQKENKIIKRSKPKLNKT